MFMPRVPNPYDDEAQKTARLEAQPEDNPRRSLILVVSGVLALVAFGILAVMGLPGAGLVLVPIGLGLLIGGGIPFILNHL